MVPARLKKIPNFPANCGIPLRRDKSQISNLQRGLTLVELLVVIGVIGVLATGLIIGINPQTQLAKARDARRKSDLANIQKALELFYNDNNRYPDPSVPAEWPAPGSPWGVYMQTRPGDPSAGRLYRYERENVGGTGQAYQLYAGLERCTSSASCFDPQQCNNGSKSSGAPDDVCKNANGSCGPGITCTYGVSSTNTTP